VTSTSRRLNHPIVRSAKGLIKQLALRGGVLVRKLPQGRQGDAYADQAALLSGRKVEHILDVGAYVGEAALRYRRIFPEATIHCFEPVPASFEQLEANVGGDPLIRTNNVAVGAGTEPVVMHVNRAAMTSSTLRPASEVDQYLSADYFEEVVAHEAKSTTVDRYCAEHEVDRVDILKLDIQGGELKALQGSTEMMSRGAISLIYLELLLAPMYEGQSGVGELLSFCESKRYRVYGLYNFEYGADTRLFQVDAILNR